MVVVDVVCECANEYIKRMTKADNNIMKLLYTHSLTRRWCGHIFCFLHFVHIITIPTYDDSWSTTVNPIDRSVGRSAKLNKSGIWDPLLKFFSPFRLLFRFTFYKQYEHLAGSSNYYHIIGNLNFMIEHEISTSFYRFEQQRKTMAGPDWMRVAALWPNNKKINTFDRKWYLSADRTQDRRRQ